MNSIRLTCLGIILLSYFQLFAQEKQLIAPVDWRTETINLPLSFAPSIPIQGIEEVRFAPGWGDSNNNEFFTYAFTWFLDKRIEPNSEDLEKYLVAYFDGLMKVVADYDEVGTSAQIDTAPYGFKGMIETKDGFFTKEGITLFCTIEKLDHGGSWLFRLSPQDWDHGNWKLLKEQVQVKQ